MTLTTSLGKQIGTASTLQELKRLTREVWPGMASEVRKDIKPFITNKDEFSEKDRVLLK